MFDTDRLAERDCGCRYDIPTALTTHRCPQHDYADIKSRIKQMDRKMRKLLIVQLNLMEVANGTSGTK